MENKYNFISGQGGTAAPTNAVHAACCKRTAVRVQQYQRPMMYQGYMLNHRQQVSPCVGVRVDTAVVASSTLAGIMDTQLFNFNF